MIDAATFRNVLSAYPTGICIITALGSDGLRHGMVVGSFSSISLTPPLVGFFPAKSSRSWQAIAESGRFCVNILGSSQKGHSDRFSSSLEDKFQEIDHLESPSGQPVLCEALAWIDCRIERVEEIGDHWLVVGHVEALEHLAEGTPLLFFKGHYHGLMALDAGA